MALIHKLFGKHKTLSDLSRQELRKEEILLTRQRDRLFSRLEQIVGQKQRIFQQGAAQKSPELRKALAQEFELKTQEQMMLARELNLRSKELLTVSRLRMIRENQSRGKALGRLKVTDRDVAKITQWIEDDSLTQEMYLQKLDQLLQVGQQEDRQALASASLGDAGRDLLEIWEQMDRGRIGQDEAFAQADRAVRLKQAEKEK